MQSIIEKYWTVFSLHWQEGLQQRASFFMERFRSLVVLLSFYYLWSALLATRNSFAGYDRAEMITYVLGTNILRGLVFGSRNDEIAYEINRGRLSAYLLKPVSFAGYTFSRDLAVKSINSLSAIIEVIVLAFILKAPIRWPHYLWQWLVFVASLCGAVVLYFLLSFLVGCWGFWTAESGGPRFCLELFLEFTAGSFFPIDVLPPALQTVFKTFPSPYMIFFPLRIFLGKLTTIDLIKGFSIQLLWIVVLEVIVRHVWRRGVSVYGAEGS